MSRVRSCAITPDAAAMTTASRAMYATRGLAAVECGMTDAAARLGDIDGATDRPSAVEARGMSCSAPDHFLLPAAPPPLLAEHGGRPPGGRHAAANRPEGLRERRSI